MRAFLQLSAVALTLQRIMIDIAIALKGQEVWWFAIESVGMIADGKGMSETDIFRTTQKRVNIWILCAQVRMRCAAAWARLQPADVNNRNAEDFHQHEKQETGEG